MKIISSKVIPHNVGIAVLMIVLLIIVPSFFVSEGSCKKLGDKSKIELETVYNKFIHFLKNKDIDAITSVLFWDVSDQDSVRDKEYLEKYSNRTCDYLLRIHPELSSITYVEHKIVKDSTVGYYNYFWTPPPRPTLAQFELKITPEQSTFKGPVVGYLRFVKVDDQWKLDFMGDLFEPGSFEQPLMLEGNDDVFKAAEEDIKSWYWQEDGNSQIRFSFIGIFQKIITLIIIISAFLAIRYYRYNKKDYKKGRRYERIGNKVVIRTSKTWAVIVSIIFIIIILGVPLLVPMIVTGETYNILELKAMVEELAQDTDQIVACGIIACLPLLMLPSLIKNLRIAFIGRTITFDGTTKKIFRNDKELAHFSTIKNFDFRNMEGIDIYLDCILTTGKKIKLGKIGDYENLKTYKADILDVVQFSGKTIDEIPSQSDEFGKVFAVAHYFILVISLLMIIGGLYAFFSSVLLSIIGTTTTGTVIDQKVEKTEKWVESGRAGRPKRKIRKTSTTVIYTVEYQDIEGNVHTFETSALDGGGSLKVVYLKFWPAYAKVKSFSGEWGPVVVLLFFGGLIFCISQMFNEKFFEKRERKRKQKIEKMRKHF